MPWRPPHHRRVVSHPPVTTEEADHVSSASQPNGIVDKSITVNMSDPLKESTSPITADKSLSTNPTSKDLHTIKVNNGCQNLTSKIDHSSGRSSLSGKQQLSGNSSDSFIAGSWNECASEPKPITDPKPSPDNLVVVFSDEVKDIDDQKSQSSSLLAEPEDTSIQNESPVIKNAEPKTPTQSTKNDDGKSNSPSTIKKAPQKSNETTQASPLRRYLADVAQEVPSPIHKDPDDTVLSNTSTAQRSPDHAKQKSESSPQMSPNSNKDEKFQRNDGLRVDRVISRGGFAPRASRGRGIQRDPWARSRVPTTYHRQREFNYDFDKQSLDGEWSHNGGWPNIGGNNKGNKYSPKTSNGSIEVKAPSNAVHSTDMKPNGATKTDQISPSYKPATPNLSQDRWVTPPKQNKANGVLIDELTPSPGSNITHSQKLSPTGIVIPQKPDQDSTAVSSPSVFPSDKQIRRALVKVVKSENFIKLWQELQPSRPTVNRVYLEPNSAEDIADFHWREYNDIGGLPLDEFWSSYVTISPPPVDTADFDFRPWWKRYKSLKSMFILPYEVPDAKLDKTDEMYEVALEELSCTQKMQDFTFDYENEQKEKENRQRAWKEHRIVPESKAKQHKPRLNIYLRSARPKDLVQMVQIFNHNLKTSWGVIEPNPIDVDQMQYRHDSLESKLFPLIVAVKRRANRKSGPRGSRVTSFASDGEDEIVGYGLVDEYGPSGSVFHHTAELDIHVREEYQDQGIGKALLDHLLYVVDIGYKKQCLVEFEDNNRFSGNGSTRPFRSIVANIIYAPKSPHKDITRYRWIRAWMENFGFKKCGDIPEAAQRQKIW
jgi:L-amino acid N-acyltransferase YncA